MSASTPRHSSPGATTRWASAWRSPSSTSIVPSGRGPRLEAQASREVRTALAEFRAQEALVKQYEAGVIGKVAQNVEATRYAYSRGAVSLLEVLDALRAQQDVMTDFYTALHDSWVAAHPLRAAQGVASPD